MKNWINENTRNPEKSGTYLCLVKWFGSEDYIYEILLYDKGWLVSNSCDHIYWMPLPDKPENI